MLKNGCVVPLRAKAIPLMFLPKPRFLLKFFCTSTKSLAWRIQIQQQQLLTQVSSILLQRHNWVPLLHNLNLSPKLTPSLFLQILHKTHSNPQISINFFNWAKQELGFQPDLRSSCQILQIAVGSGLYQAAKPILDSLIQNEPTTVLVSSLLQACRGKSSQSQVLSFVIEAYADKGFLRQALEVYITTRVYGDNPCLVSATNALFNAFEKETDLRSAWCFLGSVIRSGLSVNNITWASVAHILCKDGKLDTVSRMLDYGIYSTSIYSSVIDSYSRSGNFEDALFRLNELYSRKLEAGFSTHSSILDGACKHGDVKMTQIVVKIMVEKSLLSMSSSGYDSTIQKLCNMERAYAAEMLYRRCCDENIVVDDATYGCLLRALSKEGRVKEAIGVYNTISEMGVRVNDKSYDAFASVLCKDGTLQEADDLLKDIISRGCSPQTSDLSKFIESQCKRGRWREADEVLNLILEKGLFLDFVCCCSLVEHYCKNKQMDLALALHDKMEKLDGKLDLPTYNVILNGLFAERRFEEAIKIFAYMRKQNLLSSDSFLTMIGGLCRENDLRAAMKLHDEMLKMGLKPDKVAYKRLIRRFK